VLRSRLIIERRSPELETAAQSPRDRSWCDSQRLGLIASSRRLFEYLPLTSRPQCSTFVLMEVETWGAAPKLELAGAHAVRPRLSRVHEVHAQVRLSQAA
jgi:hypothetical protein